MYDLGSLPDKKSVYVEPKTSAFFNVLVVPTFLSGNAIMNNAQLLHYTAPAQ
jgi:hypothetical protein